ncbi:MAG: helix-turn-helix domain-containing protein [Acidimicrobiales bacterium]
MEHTISGVGVIDKAAALLSAVERGPVALAGLVERTGFSRATAHRLASALEVHGLLRRDGEGRFALGSRLLAMGQAAARAWPIAEAAAPALAELRDATGESAQIYVRDGADRVCVASLESPHGLRTIVATGAVLPLDRGSGGRVLSGQVDAGGYVVSVEERQAGVASVSAPVRHGAATMAAVSVSGPIERLTRDPGPVFGPPVVAAAAAIARAAGLDG